MKAADLIKYLDLNPHPEGGYFRETYRAAGIIPRSALGGSFTGDRNYATSIYFLLKQGDYSAFHRIKSDEGWHFYEGDPLLIHIIDPEGSYRPIRLGRNLQAGELYQCVVPAGYWFASEPAPQSAFALVGCTVSPGFDFEDFEMASREGLTSLFPQHRSLIERLSR